MDKISPQNTIDVLDDLEAYIAEEGPFDGVMGFSEGAALAAMLMIRKSRQDHVAQHVKPLFKCAVFFGGGVPADPTALEHGEFRLLDSESIGEPISVPTAHIWGKNDREYPTFGPVLSQLCKADSRSVFIHEGGHEVPGSRDRASVISAAQIIRRVIAEALDAQ